MMKLLVLALVVAACQARQLNRCQLVRELRAQGFPEAKMRDWVCLVEHESGGRTHQLGTVNHNGSRDYGLFQINDKYWCSKSTTAGKDCNVTCADVTTDDITKASKCAKKIFKRHGFMAWYGWRNHCQNKPLPDISSWVCLVENESHSRTDIIGKVNHNGSRDYGLFQINDKYWCSNTTTPGKDCHVTCTDLLTDDITKASKCAKKIFKRHGFMAWYGWRNHCKDKPLPDISNCH